MTNTSQLLYDWIESGNEYNTEKYISYFDDNAVINEHAIGIKIKGKKAIKDYFETYFIGYKTHTTITKLSVEDDYHTSINIRFVGDFPQKELDGWFNITFNQANDRIVFADTGFTE